MGNAASNKTANVN
uniref:Uncharacterized protein n=1 Tax=Anguilla anguilla TaxID=7936 RepID=A0A0E9UCF1_ANGAN